MKWKYVLVVLFAGLIAGCSAGASHLLVATPTTQQAANLSQIQAQAQQALTVAQQTAAQLASISSPTTQESSELTQIRGDIARLQTALGAIPPANTGTPAVQQVTAAVGAVAGSIPTPYTAYIAAGASLLLLLERLYQNYQTGGTGSALANISATITQAAADIAMLTSASRTGVSSSVSATGNATATASTPASATS